WHSLRIHRKPEVFDVMFKLAKEYRLALRVREQPLIDKVQHEGFPANDYDFLDSYLLETPQKPSLFAKALRDLPPGLREWAGPPRLHHAELPAIDPAGPPVRQADLDFLVPPAARALIEQEGITLLSYQPLQAVWQSILAR